MHCRVLWISCLLLFGYHAFAQSTKPSKYDKLKGELTPLRTCFDVTCYEIDLKVIPILKRLEGKNTIYFKANSNFQQMQIDLHMSMQIDSIKFGKKLLKYNRDSSVIYINMPRTISKGEVSAVSIYFSGIPIESKRPPWSGGFVWEKDNDGNDFIGVACESIGASSWFPCKDHWSDEPDSMHMRLSVPQHLTGVSNGRLISVSAPKNGYKTFHWRVGYPINLYGITVNIAKYVHMQDEFTPRIHQISTPLKLNYYVLEYNKTKAETHFKQVHTMLGCFERYFGLYPFWNDGYKLVEAPYWGMEHQSCVAYGNNYQNNKYGFDFIIIHESAHEWFANSITADDPAEMWIHESFTTYAEALYVECIKGKDMATKYLMEQRKLIQNKERMVGPRGVYFHDRKDNDIYYKGAWILHTLRHKLDNDSLFFGALYGFTQTFKHRITSTQEVIDYFSQATKYNLKPFFEQYLYELHLPEFEYKMDKTRDDRLIMRYRWSRVNRKLELPIQVTATKGKWETITPRKRWQLLDLNFFNEDDFDIRHENYLINIRRIEK
jgi:aminopeptidase N